jgi:hypothetical protein
MSYDSHTTKTEINSDNIAKTILEKLPQPIIVADEKGKNKLARPFVLLPESNGSYSVADLGSYREEKRAFREDFTELSSFFAYIERFKTPETQIYFHKGEVKSHYEAVFDDLAPGSEANAGRNHTVRYTLPFSEEFIRWQTVAKKSIAHLDFGEFLDENYADVVEPDGIILKEIALSLEASVDSEYTGAKRLRDGSGNISWKVNVRTKAGASGELEVPNEIKLFIPIFEGGDPFPLSARFRVRIADGQAKFIILPNKWEKSVKSAIVELTEKIRATAGVPTYVCEK